MVKKGAVARQERVDRPGGRRSPALQHAGGWRAGESRRMVGRALDQGPDPEQGGGRAGSSYSKSGSRAERSRGAMPGLRDFSFTETRTSSFGRRRGLSVPRDRSPRRIGSPPREIGRPCASGPRRCRWGNDFATRSGTISENALGFINPATVSSAQESHIRTTDRVSSRRNSCSATASPICRRPGIHVERISILSANLVVLIGWTRHFDEFPVVQLVATPGSSVSCSNCSTDSSVLVPTIPIIAFRTYLVARVPALLYNSSQ